MYDWDVLKRHQEQQGGTGGAMPAGASAGDAPRVDDGKDVMAKNIATGDLSGAMGPGGSGSNVSPRGGPVPNGGMNMGAQVPGRSSEEVGGEQQASGGAPTRRSLISSIRHSLFGSRNGARADGGSASAPSQSNKGR